MTVSSTSTDWIHEGAEGAEVAEYDSGGYTPRITITTIAKLTKTQIVLANEQRYNRATQHGMGTNLMQLLPASDPQVRRVQDRETITNLGSQVDRLSKDVRDRRMDMYAALDAIEQAVREARAAIHGKEA